MKRNRKNKKGFALVFVAGLLLVLGVVLISTFPLEIDKQAKALDRNENKLEEIRRALSAYAGNNDGDFPCPADQNAPLDSQDFGGAAGEETCDGVNEAAVQQGGLPVKALGLPISYAFDSHQRRFLYVVDNSGGDNIQIRDAAGVEILGEGGGEIQKFSAVVLSHGKNGFGAYNRGASSSGAVIPTQSACPSAIERPNENENCDGDSNFVDAPPSADYDDIMMYITPCTGGACGQALLLDASNPTLINAGAPSDGESVEIWADSSEAANNVAQSLGTGVRPVWGADTINGRKVITFDGNDYLQSLTSFFPTDTHSVFVVAESTANADDDFFGTGSTTNGEGDVLLTNNSSKFRGQFYTDSSANTADSTNASVTYPSLYNQNVDATTISLFRNGAQEKAATAIVGTKNNKTKSVFIGARSASDSSKMFNGNIAEVIAYPYAVSQEEREEIECDMAKKWGVFPREGLQAWYDATDIDGDGDTTDNPSNGASVATWEDKTTNSFDLTSMSDTTRTYDTKSPTYNTTGVSSKPGVAFDGTGNDVLATAGQNDLLRTATNSITVLAALSSNSTETRTFASYDGQSYGAWFMYPNKAAVGNGSAWSRSSDPLTVPLGAAISSYSYNGSTISHYKNGALVGSSPAVYTNMGKTIPATEDRFRIGRDGFDNALTRFKFSGSVGELLIYNRALSSGERKVAECYLAGKWGIDVTSGLIGRWELNGNVNSASGLNVNNGTVAGTLDYSTGRIGDAATFSDGDRINISPFTDFDLSSGTLCSWFYPTDVTPGDGARVIALKQNAYAIYLSAGSGNNLPGTLTVNDFSSGSPARHSTTQVTANDWYHTCLTFESGVTNATKLYLNGAPIFTTTTTVKDQTQGVAFGNCVGGGCQFLGSLDDIRIYDRPLTATQVQALYISGNP